MKNRVRFLVAAAIALTAHAQTSYAQSSAAEPWKVQLRPYVWISGMDGVISAAGLPEVHVDSSFSEVMEQFDIGGFLAIEADKGKSGLSGDIMYIRLSDSGYVQPGVPAKARVKATTALLVGKHEISKEDALSVHVLGGLRYVSADIRGEVSYPSPGPTLNVTRSASWLEPTVGIKGNYVFNPKLRAEATLLFAVFSNDSWEASANLFYDLSNTTSVFAGYRLMKIERSEDSFAINTEIQGPVVGMSFGF